MGNGIEFVDGVVAGGNLNRRDLEGGVERRVQGAIPKIRGHLGAMWKPSAE